MSETPQRMDALRRHETQIEKTKADRVARS